MADISKDVRNAAEANKIVLGRDVTMKNLKAGKLKAVVFASNCPKEWKQEISSAKGVELLDYSGNGLDLGATCKKPFAVTVAGIMK